MAESLVAQRKFPEAIKALEKALNLADTDEVRYIIYYNLAVSYYYIDNTEMSLEYLDKAFAFKDAEELHFLRAEIYMKSDVKKAINEYKYLISVNPDNADYVIKLANIYVKRYDYVDARKLIKAYLRKHPAEKEKFSAYGMLSH